MEKEITLICIPYAGAGFNAYTKLERYFSPRVALLTLEPPGRGMRILEEPIEDIGALVGDYYGQLQSRISGEYAIFGHSLGAIVAGTLAKKLVETGGQKPIRLFVSGMNAPSAQRAEQKRSELPKNELIDTLKRFGGTPEEVFQDEALFDFIEPIIRSDFRTLDNYSYTPSTPIDTPISVAYGRHDKNADRAGVEPWKLETSAFCDFKEFDGGHFFIFERAREFASYIESKLPF